jgi:hypothetical protein
LNRGYIILAVVLVVSLVSIGLYFVPVALSNQTRVNNLMCRDVLLWSEEMILASHYLDTFPTNLGVDSAHVHVVNAEYIAYTLAQYGSNQLDPYYNMELMTGALEHSLLGYLEGLPVSVWNVTQSASQTLKTMSEKIDNITQLTNLQVFRQPNGTSPNQIFDVLNSKNSIVSYCEDAYNYTAQVNDASPKLVYP